MAKLTAAESKQGGFGGRVPKGLYRVRCIGTKCGKSQKGNLMTTLTLEIISPESVEIDGVPSVVAGQQGNMYLTHVPNETWGQAQVYPLCKKLGVELPEVDDGMGGKTLEYDTDLHKEYFHGREFDTVLNSTEEVARYELTDEDRAQGKKMGDTIKDGEGNEIKRGWRLNMISPQDVPEFCNPELNQEIASQPY